MLIDGEKWACEACVRGHRVSNCQHSDRPLQHINKKGRPVSQCQHCRAMRKSRASHVKCDCGEKTHKCQHLKQTLDGHKESCCCNHGGRCTCSHKKETALDTVPESESDTESQQSKPKAINRRRRANTAVEPVLSFDENGHHKPSHRPSKASQKCGPYSLSRGQSMRSSSSSSSLRSGSFDSMSNSKSSNSSSSSFSHSKSSASPEKSEQPSPNVSTLSQLNGQLPPLDLSNVQYPTMQNFELFGGFSDEPPLFSAGLTAQSIDWTPYDGLDMNGDAFSPSSYGQSHNNKGPDSGFTISREPTLVSSSGDVSETDEFLPAFGEPQIEGFRTNATSSFLNMAQQSPASGMLGTNDLNTLDFDQFKGVAAGSKFMTNTQSLEETNNSNGGFPLYEDDGYWMGSNFTDGITQSPDPVASAFWDTQ